MLPSRVGFVSHFRRGWPGVEEVVLGQVPKSGERTFQHPCSILLGRVEDYCFDLEALGVAPSDKDIKAIAALVRSARGLPYLWENPLEPEPSEDSPALRLIKILSPTQRYNTCAAITTLLNGPIKKALAQSEGSK